MADVHGASAHPIEGKLAISIPGFQKEGAIPFSASLIQLRHPAAQFLSQIENSLWVLAPPPGACTRRCSRAKVNCALIGTSHHENRTYNVVAGMYRRA